MPATAPATRPSPKQGMFSAFVDSVRNTLRSANARRSKNGDSSGTDGDSRRRLMRLLSIGAVSLVLAGAFTYAGNAPCLADASQSWPGLTRYLEPQTARLRLAGTPDAIQSVLSDWETRSAACATHNAGNWRSSAAQQLWLSIGSTLFITLFGVVCSLLIAQLMRTSLLRLLGFTTAVSLTIACVISLLSVWLQFRALDFTNTLGLPSGVTWLFSFLLSPETTAWVAAIGIHFGAITQLLLQGGAVLYGVTALIVWAVRAVRRVDDGYDPKSDKTPGTVPYSSTPLPGATGEEAQLRDVLQSELEYIQHHRYQNDPRRPTARSLVGLALSGGGIRSATTCLGVLQSLAQLKILPLVDYVSSVSGGGYIASCLSSLLSLNANRMPDDPSAGESEKGNPHLFKATDKLAFSTAWESFPFRDDRNGTPEASRAAELVAHLRTHGNFLIARRGVLTRDTLRAVGNILTGIGYHLAGFFVMLFGATALYLAVVEELSPNLKSSLARVVEKPAVVAPALPKRAAADTARTIELTQLCATVDSATTEACKISGKAADARPTFGTWLAFEFESLTTPVRKAIETGRDDVWTVRQPLIAAVFMGIGLTLVVLTIISAALATFRGPGSQPAQDGMLAPPQPGESDDDVFDKALLWASGLFALGCVGATTYLWRSKSIDVIDGLVALWLPLVTLASARVTGFFVAILAPRALGVHRWSRRFRTLFGGYLAILIYGMWGAIMFLVLTPLMFALAEHGATLALGGLASLLMSRFLTQRKGSSKLTLGPALKRSLLAVAVFLTIALGMLLFGAILINKTGPVPEYWVPMLVAFAFVFVLGWLVDMNKLSPHYFYRDRLAETYLFSELQDTKRRMWTFRDAIAQPLSNLHGDVDPDHPAGDKTWRNHAPYHLINCAINLSGSRDLTRKDRKSGYWLFSKLYCGSLHTGFRPTSTYRGGDTKLGRAIAISGAAASTGMGFHTFFAQSFATALFNVRLGYWSENPRSRRSQNSHEGMVFWPAYLWREVTMQTTDNNALVNLSDGGHTGDNVGIYPLLQRRCKVIIAVDAEADAGMAFGSFTEALRHAYVDEGIKVDIDLTMIRPDPKTGLSRGHCAVGRILYPDRLDQASWIIYLKNSLTGDEPEPVLNYKTVAPDFPHESTADQFFTDAQFESYRALGVHIAKSVFARWSDTGELVLARDVHDPVPAPTENLSASRAGGTTHGAV